MNGLTHLAPARISLYRANAEVRSLIVKLSENDRPRSSRRCSSPEEAVHFLYFFKILRQAWRLALTKRSRCSSSCPILSKYTISIWLASSGCLSVDQDYMTYSSARSSNFEYLSTPLRGIAMLLDGRAQRCFDATNVLSRFANSVSTASTCGHQTIFGTLAGLSKPP